jgi:hypothetical protein
MRGLFISSACTLILFFLYNTSAIEARQAQVNPTATPSAEAVPQVVAQNPQILSPKPGQVLQGNIPVVVDTTFQKFQSVELTFGYANNPTQTWFLIYQGLQPVTNGPLAAWDTSLITDGDYNLRMVITFLDGSQQTVEVAGLRVRNYSPVETDTPMPATPTSPPATAEAPVPTITPTLPPSALPPAATPLPPNPAELQQQDIWFNAGKGVLAIVGLFALAGLYQAVRSLGRQK